MNDSIYFELEEEKKKILKMVEEKKISAEEADRLINILEDSVLKEEATAKIKEDNKYKSEGDDEFLLKKEKIPNVKGKLVVHVYENGVKKVNVQLPIALVKMADKIPIQTNEQSQIPVKDILKSARESGLNIEQGMFVLVKDDEVHIYDADGIEFVNVKDIKKEN